MFRMNRNKHKTNRNSLIGSIFCYFTENLEFFLFFPFLFVFMVFPVFSGFIRFYGFSGFFRFVSKQFVLVVSLLYRNRKFRCFHWTETREDPTKQFKREYIWEIFRKFKVVSVCFGLLRNRSVCFSCFDIDSKHRNKPKYTKLLSFAELNIEHRFCTTRFFRRDVFLFTVKALRNLFFI